MIGEVLHPHQLLLQGGWNLRLEGLLQVELQFVLWDGIEVKRWYLLILLDHLVELADRVHFQE